MPPAFASLLPLNARAVTRTPAIGRWLRATALALAAGAALLAGSAAHAQGKTLKIASAFDPNTLDPHAIALLYHTRISTQLYEGLVGRDREFKLEPALALRWQTVNPTTWRFTLRPDVRFHDGSVLSADDVVFSLQRAMAKTSQRRLQLNGVAAVRAVDPLTVDIQTTGPDAVLPDKLVLVAIMSKAWAEKHGATLPQDFNAKQEMHTVRNANGTGPFLLKRYEPDRRLVLARHEGWWGWNTSAAAPQANVGEAIFSVVQSDATRLAALASGEVDLVLDPPFQDIARLKQDKRVRVASFTDIGAQYLGFNVSRAALEGSDRNPFRDLRVRRAVAQAIDIDTIVAKVLRGQGKPTGAPISPLVDGYVAALETRLPYDPAAARRLLAEAGYADGFAVTLDCVNITFRAAVCQAIAAMLAQVNIKVTFQPSPSTLFFPKLTQATTDFYEVGWSPAADAWTTLNALWRSPDGKGGGTFNAGGYSNPKLDALIDAIRVEPDLVRRRALVGDALRIVHAELPLLPLYRRGLNWAMRPTVHVAPLPNDVLELRWVRID